MIGACVVFTFAAGTTSDTVWERDACRREGQRKRPEDGPSSVTPPVTRCGIMRGPQDTRVVVGLLWELPACRTCVSKSHGTFVTTAVYRSARYGHRSLLLVHGAASRRERLVLV